MQNILRNFEYPARVEARLQSVINVIPSSQEFISVLATKLDASQHHEKSWTSGFGYFVLNRSVGIKIPLRIERIVCIERHDQCRSALLKGNDSCRIKSTLQLLSTNNEEVSSCMTFDQLSEAFL